MLEANMCSNIYLEQEIYIMWGTRGVSETLSITTYITGHPWATSGLIVLKADGSTQNSQCPGSILVWRSSPTPVRILCAKPGGRHDHFGETPVHPVVLVGSVYTSVTCSEQISGGKVSSHFLYDLTVTPNFMTGGFLLFICVRKEFFLPPRN